MDATTYARRHAARFVSELAGLVSIPTVSADSRRAPDMRRCARRLTDLLTAAGLHHARTLEPTAGAQPAGGSPAPAAAPIVAADWLDAPGAPTVLFYGHYDVQPADEPGWAHPPFTPVVRGDELHGRGASDDKGQLFAHLKGIESLLATRHALPVNVRVILEGEEENHLPTFFRGVDMSMALLDELAARATVANPSSFSTPRASRRAGSPVGRAA